MKFIRYTVIIFILSGQFAFAQSRVADSLVAILKHAEGIQKIDVLNQLTFEFLLKDNSKALKYCDQAISLGNQLDYPKGLGQAYTYKGVYEYLSGEFSDGRGNLRRGLNLAIKIHDKGNQGYTLMQLGNSFINQGQLDSALFFYNNSYEVLKDSAYAATLSKLYRNLSAFYGLRSQSELEKKFLIRSMRIRTKLNDKPLITEALILLAGIHIREGNFAEANQNLARANQLLIINPDDQENRNDWRRQKALVLLQENRHQEALALFDSAISYYSRKSLLQKYVTLQADLGKVFNNRGEYEVAIKCFEDGLKVAETKGYEVEIADINLQIGWANFNLGDLDQTLRRANQTLSWAEKNNMTSRIGDALILKGITLSTLKDFAQAKVCFDKALSIREQLKDYAKISEAYENLGYMEFNKGNFAVSLVYYQKSLSPAEVAKYEFGKIWSLLGLGMVNTRLGKFHEASDFLDQAEEKALSNNAKEALTYVYNAKTDLFEAQKNFKQSLHYSRLAFALHDSLHRSEVGRRFAGLQRFEEIRQKEREIKSLNQQKELAQERILVQEQKLDQQYYLILFSVVLIGLLAVLALIYARFYFRVKRLNSAINQQKEELQSQSNYIHQLNKNLEGLVAEKTIELQKTNQELIKQNDELLQFSYSISHNLRGPVARLLGLANIFRHSKDMTEQNLMIDYIFRASEDLDGILKDLSKIIDVRNDLHNLKEWVNLEEEWLKSRSLLKDVIKEQFQIAYNFEKAPKIFTVKAFVQSLFYNLLSNAIKYRSDKRNLIIHASIRIENGNGLIEITDNGLGIDMVAAKGTLFKLFKRFHTHVEGRGLGLYLIKSQLESLNGSVKVESMVNQGTTFKVMIPDVLKDQSAVGV